MRESYIFYASFYDAIKELDSNDRLVVYDAINEYSLTGYMPILTGIPKAIMTLIKPQVDANQRRFENGQKGGRPKSEKQHNKDVETKDKPNQNQEQTEEEPNVNDNVNVNDNQNVNENENLSLSDLKVVFEKFRKNYQGTKRSLETEFKNFQRQKDWKVVVFKLFGILEQYKFWRESAKTARMFVPEWKNLQTWINQRCWEDELPEIKPIEDGQGQLPQTAIPKGTEGYSGTI